MIEKANPPSPSSQPLDPHEVEAVVRTLRYAVEAEKWFGVEGLLSPELTTEGISFKNVQFDPSAPSAAPSMPAPAEPGASPTPKPTSRPPAKDLPSTPPKRRPAPPVEPYPSLTMDEREQQHEEMRKRVMACQDCRLHGQRTQAVFSDGPLGARLMLVGEGPGADEDRTGVPFVGKAGQLLNKIIAAMGLQREEVYIANVVKCRPPGNRTPQPDEAEKCFAYLRKQIELVQPEVIGALGTPALQALLKLNTSMARARGRVFRLGPARVVPTYHPAYLLRNPKEKVKVWQDVQVMMRLLE